MKSSNYNGSHTTYRTLLFRVIFLYGAIKGISLQSPETEEDTHSFSFEGLTLELLNFLCAEICSEQMFNVAGNVIDQGSR